MSNASFATTTHVRDTCLCLHVQRAARLLARRFDAALRPLGLTHGQFSLINALNRPTPTPMAPVASLLGVDRTTLTALLKPLLRKGLVKVSVDPDDARGRLVVLSARGCAVLQRAVPIWRKVHAEIEKPLASPQKLRRELSSLV